VKIVLDTNVLVSAVIRPQGGAGAVLQRLRQRDFIALISRATLSELAAVLHQSRLRTKYNLTDRRIRTVLRVVVLRSELLYPQRKISICRDPKDDQLLEVAVAGKADAIVTGDADLLSLHPFEGIPVIPPAFFLSWLNGQNQ
jgi:uncharacterized protein